MGDILLPLLICIIFFACLACCCKRKKEGGVVLRVANHPAAGVPYVAPVVTYPHQQSAPYTLQNITPYPQTGVTYTPATSGVQLSAHGARYFSANPSAPSVERTPPPSYTETVGQIGAQRATQDLGQLPEELTKQAPYNPTY